MRYNRVMGESSQIILVESSSVHRKLLSFNLSVYVGVEVVYKHNAEDVIDFLKYDGSDVRIVISEESVGKEQTMLKIYYHIISNNLDITMICSSGQCEKLVGKIEIFSKNEWQKIIRRCGEIVRVSAKDMARKKIDQYYPVSLNTFLAMQTTPVRVFIQRGAGKFDVLLEKGDAISLRDIRQRLFWGESDLFVLSTERLVFADNFSNQIFNWNGNEEMTGKERVETTGVAFENVCSLVKTVGMSDEVVKMAKVVVKSVVNIASSSHGLSDLIEIFEESKESYLYLHSLLISVVSYQVIGAMGWGNEEQKIKLAFAALFHDITIPEQRLCKIHSQEELERAGLGEEDKKAVLCHAYHAAELVKSVSHLPFGVDTIIIQHHGSLNGVGFEREEQDVRLSKLAMVFLVAEEYCDSLIEEGVEIFQHERAIKKLENRYIRKDFRQIVDALNRVFSH